MKHMKLLIVTLAAMAALAVGARTASADTILIFGQAVGGNPVVGTSDGINTSINGLNIPVFITFIQNGAPGTAFLNFLFSSTSPVVFQNGEAVQNFTGSWQITSGIGGTGTNFLSGSFTDVGHGAGNSFTLNAGTAGGDSISPFFSDVITSLGLERALAFSFTNVTPPIPTGPVGGRETFTAAVSGDFSANIVSRVPEPMSLVLLGSGLVGLSQRRLWRRKA
jgi:hypothetical protein